MFNEKGQVYHINFPILKEIKAAVLKKYIQVEIIVKIGP